MEKEKYHHGDLKRALIEAGIEIMNESGEAELSLRKTAARCGVSQAAPYAHFESKDALMEAMQQHVTDQMMQQLMSCVKEENSAYDNMLNLGEAYIQFFIKHPSYLKFMCFSSHIHFDFTQEVTETTYLPFRMFRIYAEACLKELGCPKGKELHCMVNLWGTVQGIAFLATQPNVSYAGNWEHDLRSIITNGRED